MFRLILFACLFALPLRAEVIDSSQGGPIQAQVMADGLEFPWGGFAFLPGGGVLVTERDGALWHVQGGRRERVAGVPEVVARGRVVCWMSWCRAISPKAARYF